MLPFPSNNCPSQAGDPLGEGQSLVRGWGFPGGCQLGALLSALAERRSLPQALLPALCGAEVGSAGSAPAGTARSALALVVRQPGRDSGQGKEG